MCRGLENAMRDVPLHRVGLNRVSFLSIFVFFIIISSAQILPPRRGFAELQNVALRLFFISLGVNVKSRRR